MPDERPSRRAAVVSRHPATLRRALLPRSQRGEFDAVLLDLDIDLAAGSFDLVQVDAPRDAA